MKEVLEKLSSYNLFNYLLPGVIFAVLAEHLTRFSFRQQDIIISAFVYYFIGLVISRVGSLPDPEPELFTRAELRNCPYVCCNSEAD